MPLDAPDAPDLTTLPLLEQRLRADGVTIVVGSIVDLGGVARAKSLPLGRLGSFVGSGVGASPTWNVFCIDDEIAFTERVTVAGDLRLRLDPTVVRVVGPGTAWAPAEFTEQDGSTSPLDTRALLRSVVAELAADGLDVLVGCELEFTLFDADADADADADGTLRRPWSAYGLSPLIGGRDNAFARELVTLADGIGLPLDQVHAEYGVRQFEISLGPTDPVSAADNVVLARLLIGRAAEKFGFRPSFSPLSSAQANAANGAHQHFSLARAGRPLLSTGTGPHGITAEGASAIAGVLRRLPEFVGFYAGSALSGQRLLPGHWSGAHVCWGLENREAAVRYCAATAGNPHGASVELKAVDASANPYLGIAAMLWSAHEGIRDDLPLPPEVAGDPAQLPAASRVGVLPSSQADAIEAIATSAAAARFTGDAILDAFLAVRGHEVDAYADAAPAALAERFRFTWSI